MSPRLSSAVQYLQFNMLFRWRVWGMRTAFDMRTICNTALYSICQTLDNDLHHSLCLIIEMLVLSSTYRAECSVCDVINCDSLHCLAPCDCRAVDQQLYNSQHWEQRLIIESTHCLREIQDNSTTIWIDQETIRNQPWECERRQGWCSGLTRSKNVSWSVSMISFSLTRCTLNSCMRASISAPFHSWWKSRLLTWAWWLIVTNCHELSRIARIITNSTCECWTQFSLLQHKQPSHTGYTWSIAMKCLELLNKHGISFFNLPTIDTGIHCSSDWRCSNHRNGCAAGLRSKDKHTLWFVYAWGLNENNRED